MGRENFSESQKFTQWWVWLISVSSIVIPMGISATKFFKYFNSEQVRNRPMAYSTLVIFCVSWIAASTLIIWLVRSSNLETRVERRSFSYRFFPFIRSWKIIQKEEIKAWKIITKKIVTSYGIQYGFDCRTFNVKGKEQLELLLYSGKRIFFGTQKSAEMKQAMTRLFETKIQM